MSFEESANGQAMPPRILNNEVEIFHSMLDESARHYWYQRGIKDEVLNKMKIGFKPGRNLYVIPYFDENGDCYVCKFVPADKSQKEFWYPSGVDKPKIYNLAAIREAETSGKKLYKAEGEKDALILIQEGYLCVGCPGAKTFKQEYAKFFAGVKEVIIVFDNDNAGRNGAQQIALFLGAKARIIDWNDYKPNLENKFDINDLYLIDPKNFKINFENLVQKARSIAQSSVERNRYSPFQLEKEEPDELILQAPEGYKFIVSGFEGNKNIVRARVELAGRCGTIYIDNILLSSGKARTNFVNKCTLFKEEEAIEAFQLEKQLLALEIISKLKISQRASCDFRNEEPPEMTEEERAEALEFLRSDNILEQIINDVTTIGYVGERINKAMVYLIATSRKLAKPLACVIKAVSSSGKNALVDSVLALIPPEEKKIISRITPNALYYMSQNGLSHKVIHIAEKVGAEDADYSIRSLLSERKLAICLPIKNPKTGAMETQEYEVEGPVAYIETTTQTHINDENDTRMFTLTVDESEEQTKRIHEAQRKKHTLAGLSQNTEAERIIRKHHNAQRLLTQIEVVIPYAEKLKFSTDRVRTRRDHEKLLYLIKTIALLRQYRKEKKQQDAIEYIEADTKDYEIAYELSSAVLGQTLDEVSKRSRDLLAVIERMLNEWLAEEGRELNLADERQGSSLCNIVFTRGDVRKYAKGLSDTAIHASMRELGDYELLKINQGGQGKTYKYTFGGQGEVFNQESSTLLTPEELSRELGEATS